MEMPLIPEQEPYQYFSGLTETQVSREPDIQHSCMDAREMLPEFLINSSDSERDSFLDELTQQPPAHHRKMLPKRKPARMLLWQFLLLQLLRGHSSLAWVEDQWSSPGVFKFTDTNEAARQWGSHKGNRNMSYEKMSRCVRDYFTRRQNRFFGVMLPDGRGKAHRRTHFAFNMQNASVVDFIRCHRPDYYRDLVIKGIVKHHL